MADDKNNKGAMYRPTSSETLRRIRAFMCENGLSWNAAINFLVLKGLRAVEADAVRNGGHFHG
jgi:uncharacterized protein (DUF2461 family)